MRQTFFYIPHSIEVAGREIPLFGWGLLAAVWLVFAVVLLAFMIRRNGFTREVKGLLPLLLVVGAAIVFLLPNLEVTYGQGDDAFIVGLPIRGYGVLLLAGVVSGVGLAAWRARRMGLDPSLSSAWRSGCSWRASSARGCST